MNKNKFRTHRPLFSHKSAAKPHKAKIKWKLLPIVWLATKRACMVLGAFVLISIFMTLIMTANVVERAVPTLPKDMVLYLNLEENLSDTPQMPSFADPFVPANLTVREIVNAIDHAATDSRVHGLFARLGDVGVSSAQAYEIRAAVKRFRDTGKFAHIYASSYGSLSGGMGRYYLTAAFDEVWMQPLGLVTIDGINAEMPFLRDMLAKIGVSPQFIQRKEFKTAYESLTNSRISSENKRMMESLVRDLRTTISAELSVDLGVEDLAFRALVDQGLFTASEALEAGLIDYADYADVLVRRIKEDVTGDPDIDDDLFVPAEMYYALSKGERLQTSMIPGLRDSKSVALIHVNGAIMQNAESHGVAASNEIAPAILDAMDDDKIRAIILRVNSPGGSPIASESILRALQLVQEKGKPVYVSMGDVAASGGYWVSAYADQIYALPTTITGSIGVVGGKFVLQDLWQKIGVNWDAVRWGDNADMWSPNQPFAGAGLERVNAMLDDVYDQFISRVAEGRDMSKAGVERIAKGRVWTGRQAKDVGLVDKLGGLDVVMQDLALELGLKGREQLDVVIMPAPKSPLEQFLELVGAQVQIGVMMDELRTMMAPITAQIYEPAQVYEPLIIR